MITYCQLDPQKETSWKFHQNIKLFVQENVFEIIVYNISSIPSSADQLTNWDLVTPYGVMEIGPH